jgi:uncharacterized protein
MPATTHEERSLPPVIETMLKPEFYSHPVSDIELKQTHTSYVLLAGDFAYKVRKAVRFPFIDCSTAARRFALCQREIELNRRLPPDIYLAVVAIKQSGGRIILDESTDDRSAAVDFAVKMRLAGKLPAGFSHQARACDRRYYHRDWKCNRRLPCTDAE